MQPVCLSWPIHTTQSVQVTMQEDDGIFGSNVVQQLDEEQNILILLLKYDIEGGKVSHTCRHPLTSFRVCAQSSTHAFDQGPIHVFAGGQGL